MNSQGADKIIVALDFATGAEATALVRQLTPEIRFFKIGLQLYTATGPQIVRDIISGGSKVFLDLKLHDIPNTVAGAVESASELGVDMLTIHLAGGEAMIRAAVDARRNDISILGVTVLTSQTDETLHSIGIGDTIGNQVLRLAKLGVSCGVQGLVASPREIKELRGAFGEKIMLVTPGIRPTGSEKGDQKRVSTPREAIDAGADYLVIGRPITAHAEPREAVKKILAELEPAQ
jgi:orotidine-5'-phosphate decarboxylase